MVANETAAAAVALAAFKPSAPPIETELADGHQVIPNDGDLHCIHQQQEQEQQQQNHQFNHQQQQIHRFPQQQYQPQIQVPVGITHLIHHGGIESNVIAAHQQTQYHAQQQHIDIALNSEFVSINLIKN